MFTANPVVGMLAFWLICMAILGVVKTLAKQETRERIEYWIRSRRGG